MNKMVEKYKNIIAAIILGVCLVVAAFLIALSNRYEASIGKMYMIDKWTGKIIEISVE